MTSAEASDPTRPINDRPIDRLVAEFLATAFDANPPGGTALGVPSYDDRLPDLLDPAVSRRNVADEQRLRALESLADRELTDQECIRNWAAHRRPSDGLDGTLVGAARPVLRQPRVVAMVQMILDLIVLGLLIRLVLGAVQTSQRRRAATRAGGDAAVEAGDPGRDLPGGS